MRLCFETCADLPPVPAEVRAAIAAGPGGRAEHRRLVAGLEVLRLVEVAPPASPAPAHEGATRIAFWNAERCKYLEPSVALLEGVGADVALLCEMDLGMARSQQLHTTRELAARLGHGYAFAVEYLELGLGDERERRWHAGSENRHGLHGAAILSRAPLQRPALIRLDANGDWFDGGRGERRVGGRLAVAATVPMGGREVAVVSVHFESHTDPRDRARQMAVLLQGVEEYTGGGPAILGGDFNTSSASSAAVEEPGRKAALLARDERRLVDPVAWEPLFQGAAAAGFEWTSCNAAGPTQRTRRDGGPAEPLGRLDWFFARGLEASAAATVAAVDGAGDAISDHELLVVSVVPAG